MDESFYESISNIDSAGGKSIEILREQAKGKKNILEIGTRFAKTTVGLALSCLPEGKVISVDINQKDARETLSKVPKEISDKIILLEGNSKVVDYAKYAPFDLIFIDGDHSFEGVRADTLKALQFLAPDCRLYWHDFTCLDVLAGIIIIPVQMAQCDGYMGWTKGTPAKSPNAHLFQLERVALAINKYLKEINWEKRQQEEKEKIYKILVPSGIGDFSWTWSKLSTTGAKYDIEYIGGKPDRMTSFLSLLPKNKIVRFAPTDNYRTKWDEKGELVCYPINGVKPIQKAYQYSDLSTTERKFVESNTHLEAGRRLEEWFPQIGQCDFHYKIEGTLDKHTRGDFFIVNFSSYGTKKAWGYYEVEESSKLVEMIYQDKGWTPFFIGGEYDDYTKDICKNLNAKGIPVIDLVGKTPKLIETIILAQQARMYFGACSGLMCLSNLVNTPVCTYYPPFEKPPGRYLAGTYHDIKIPMLHLFWEGRESDEPKIKGFINEL